MGINRITFRMTSRILRTSSMLMPALSRPEPTTEDVSSWWTDPPECFICLDVRLDIMERSCKHCNKRAHKGCLALANQSIGGIFRCQWCQHPKEHPEEDIPYWYNNENDAMLRRFHRIPFPLL